MVVKLYLVRRRMRGREGCVLQYPDYTALCAVPECKWKAACLLSSVLFIEHCVHCNIAYRTMCCVLFTVCNYNTRRGRGKGCAAAAAADVLSDLLLTLPYSPFLLIQPRLFFKII